MTPVIRPAGPDDVPALCTAFKALSQLLGDPWTAEEDAVRRAGFGPHPAFHAVLAKDGDAVLGAAMFSPVFSTIRGAPGLFVSDLWAAEDARGTGMGRRLLAAAAARAGDLWGARWMKLAVHHDNPRARVFYDRLGFTPDAAMDVMALEEADLRALGDK